MGESRGKWRNHHKRPSAAPMQCDPTHLLHVTKGNRRWNVFNLSLSDAQSTILSQALAALGVVGFHESSCLSPFPVRFSVLSFFLLC